MKYLYCCFKKFISTSNAKTVLVRGSDGIEVYFIAELEVYQIWREIIVKILLKGFSYCKLLHAFESLRRIEFLIKFVFGLEGNDVLVSSAALIPLYKELLKFPGGVTFSHLKNENSSYDYRTQS